MSFLTDLCKDDAFALADKETSASEFTTYIDTGSYLFNMQLSGSIFAGVPNNKVIALAGESTTGKTIFSLSLCKTFLASDKTAGVLYFDTESAIPKDVLVQQGIDPKRMIMSQPETLQAFRKSVFNFIEKYEALDVAKRPPILMVLDSLGQLPSLKELTDAEEGKDVRDMTRSQIIRSIFRTIRLKLSKLQVPMIVTNHTYKIIGISYGPSTEMGGGQGLKYSSDIIIELSKKAVKDEEKVVTGFIIHSKTVKSRFTKERTSIDMLLSYEKGLDRYYGLLDEAVEVGLVEKNTSRYTFPNKPAVFAKAIEADPEAYWTPDILTRLDEMLKPKYLFNMVATSVTSKSAEDGEDSDEL